MYKQKGKNIYNIEIYYTFRAICFLIVLFTLKNVPNNPMETSIPRKEEEKNKYKNAIS